VIPFYVTTVLYYYFISIFSTGNSPAASLPVAGRSLKLFIIQMLALLKNRNKRLKLSVQ
jgi:hypothetical protein